MSKWSPNAQMAGLKYSGIIALILSLHFLSLVVLEILEIYMPNNALLSQPWLVHLPLITVLLTCVVMLRYFIQLKKMKAGGWQSMFLILKDEYTLSIYRNGAAKSFLVIIHLGMVFFHLSFRQGNDPTVMPFLTTQTMSATLMFSAVLVFGLVVMRKLNEEED